MHKSWIFSLMNFDHFIYCVIITHIFTKKFIHKVRYPSEVNLCTYVPGLGVSPRGGNGNPPQYSCLGNPMDRGAWPATVHGVAESWTQLTEHTFTIDVLTSPLSLTLAQIANPSCGKMLRVCGCQTNWQDFTNTKHLVSSFVRLCNLSLNVCKFLNILHFITTLNLLYFKDMYRKQ